MLGELLFNSRVFSDQLQTGCVDPFFLLFLGYFVAVFVVLAR